MREHGAVAVGEERADVAVARVDDGDDRARLGRRARDPSRLLRRDVGPKSRHGPRHQRADVRARGRRARRRAAAQRVRPRLRYALEEQRAGRAMVERERRDAMRTVNVQPRHAAAVARDDVDCANRHEQRVDGVGASPERRGGVRNADGIHDALSDAFARDGARVSDRGRAMASARARGRSTSHHGERVGTTRDEQERDGGARGAWLGRVERRLERQRVLRKRRRRQIGRRGVHRLDASGSGMMRA